MRHRVKKYQHFKGKDFDHKTAMVRNLVTSFFLHNSIITTEKKAGAIVPIIASLISSISKKAPMGAVRLANSMLYTEEASRKLIEVVAPKMKDRDGGYTRITPIKLRSGDSAKIVKVELVS